MDDFLVQIEKLALNALEEKRNIEFLTREKFKTSAEVLLLSIKIDKNGVTVYPTNCPGKGRKDDVLLDNKGRTACMYNSKSCPYFSGTEFNLEDYTKNVFCNAV